jgi:multidrug efflux pump
MEEEPELSPAAAAKKAMAQLTGADSVFVSVGFIAGISGCCSSKIAVTIIAAVC